MKHIIGKCIEASEMAAAYTRDKQRYDGLIIELAIIPIGVEVRGMMTHNGKYINHASLCVSWGGLELSKSENPLSSAVIEISNTLSSKT